MSYCINPLCAHRQNSDDFETCISCGTSLLINNRVRLINPIRPLTDNPYNYFDVFEVEDAGTKWHPVCEKRVMKILKWNTPKLIELIERESLTLQLIRHPKIPRSSLDDYFTFVPNNSFLTLHCLLIDKFDGDNLEKWVEANGKISQSLALDWLKQLIEVLSIVHGSNFFHRDIKPSNIILQPSGELALVDFGTARRVTETYLAKVSGSGGTGTGRGGIYEITTIVTPRYTPLEQINGQAVPQSDFYALGRTFVHLVTGTSLMRLPIDEKTGGIIWRNKASQIDKPFADFIDELMAPLPGQRPQTTRVILQRLERIPLQSKINRIVKSPLFQVSAVTVLALSSFGLYWSLRPAIADYLMYLGKKAQQENRFDNALEKFQQAVNFEPAASDSVSKFYVEQAWTRNITPEDARKYYELAIKFNPKNDTAYNNLALLCQQLQDFQCVNDNYAKVFKLKPDKWESRYGLGSFYDDLGKYDLAEEQYKLAIKSSELALDAVSNLARIKNLQGEYNVAIDTAWQGLKKAKDPGLKAALYKSIGWAKLEQGKYSEAKKYLEQAQKLDIQRTDTYCLLAKTEEALGNVDNAWNWWQACLLSKSDLPEVLIWRDEVLERLRLPRSSKNRS
ncbi:serine/threonine protein kinase (plasmid) [Nostoc sp. HK-01]|nr:serine/threonine protein kinase [Nostoc sp. HK-01]